MSQILNSKHTVNEHTGSYKFNRVVDERYILDLASSIASKRILGEAFTSSSRLAEYVTALIGREEAEKFLVLFLDSQHRVIHSEVLFHGTIDAASVYPREVVKAALKYNAAKIVLAHNHPSGVTNPSQADQAITNKLKQGLALLDIPILDHLIVTPQGSHVSFVERGLL